jgi:hypothetical protein
MFLKSSNDMHLLPWQLTTLNWMVGATIALFITLALIGTLQVFLSPKKKQLGNKIYNIFCFTLLVLFLAFGISTLMGISFFIDVKLGWKLSLLAGALVILCAVSLVMALRWSIRPMQRSKMSSSWIYVWIILGVISFISIICLIAASLPNPILSFCLVYL